MAAATASRSTVTLSGTVMRMLPSFSSSQRALTMVTPTRWPSLSKRKAWPSGDTSKPTAELDSPICR